MLSLPFRCPRDLPLAVAGARAALQTHGVVALPTETLYGLAVSPEDERAVESLYALKGRTREKSLPVAVACLDQLDAIALLPAVWRPRLAAVWPAPLAVVLHARHQTAAFAETVAVRIPAHELLRSLLARLGPLTVTSANRSGQTPARSAAEVSEWLGHGVALVLDGGDAPGGAPSTLLDLTAVTPTIIRSGAWQMPPGWAQDGD